MVTKRHANRSLAGGNCLLIANRDNCTVRSQQPALTMRKSTVTVKFCQFLTVVKYHFTAHSLDTEWKTQAFSELTILEVLVFIFAYIY